MQGIQFQRKDAEAQTEAGKTRVHLCHVLFAISVCNFAFAPPSQSGGKPLAVQALARSTLPLAQQSAIAFGVQALAPLSL
jgi:hypothetical protein